MGVAPWFVSWIVIAAPVLSVILVAFSGGLTEHARQMLKAAAVVQAVTVVLGVISAASAAAATQPSPDASWFVFEAAGLAIVTIGLIFTVAVTRSQAVRSLAPGFQYLGEDDEDFEDDDLS